MTGQDTITALREREDGLKMALRGVLERHEQHAERMGERWAAWIKEMALDLATQLCDVRDELVELGETPQQFGAETDDELSWATLARWYRNIDGEE